MTEHFLKARTMITLRHKKSGEILTELDIDHFCQANLSGMNLLVCYQFLGEMGGRAM